MCKLKFMLRNISKEQKRENPKNLLSLCTLIKKKFQQKVLK